MKWSVIDRWPTHPGLVQVKSFACDKARRAPCLSQFLHHGLVVCVKTFSMHLNIHYVCLWLGEYHSTVVHAIVLPYSIQVKGNPREFYCFLIN